MNLYYICKNDFDMEQEKNTEQIEKVLLSDLEIEDKVIKLIRKSNNRGGTDNISIAYLEFSESGD